MIKSYFLILFRNARKKPVYTCINLAGLAIGIACFVFIAIYVWDESGFDRHHTKGDDIFRVTQTTHYNGDETQSASTPFPLKSAIDNDLQGYVSESVRFFDMEAPNVSIGNRERELFFREEHFFFTDPSVFTLFDIALIRGNAESALSEPGSVVITPEVASRYFGDEDPMGQQLLYEGQTFLTVTGVMEEWPRQSHIRADLLASFESLRDIWRNYDQITERWLWASSWTYILAVPGTEKEFLEEQLSDFSDRYYASFFGENEEVVLNLQPLKEIYLHSAADNEIGPTSSFLYIVIFSAIAVLILLIACINYINLSTARALTRSKEVGLRKTLGADEYQLRMQFLFESLIYTVFAVLLSAFIVITAMPYFNMFTGKEVEIAAYSGYTIAGVALLLIAGITLLAGFYPATFLSGYKPIEAVKGTFTQGQKGGKLRKSLVIFQFTITAILLIGTSLAYLQYQHMQRMDMGFEREQVIVVPSSMSLAIWYYDEFKERVLTHSGIHNVSGSKTVLGSDIYYTYQIAPEGYGEQEAFSIAKLFVAHDFLETMDIDLLSGRDFSTEFSTDPEDALIINRAMVDSMEWGTPEEALGKTFQLAGKTGSVVGVTDDFHFAHLRYDLEPLILDLPSSEVQFVSNIDYIKIRLSGTNPDDALAHIQSVWDDLDPTHPFDFFFLDRKIDEMYQQEQQFSTLMGVFTILALGIGCLGLLGLASYSISKRTREIGIRKAMGATAVQIFYLLSKDYVKLIVVAHLIALPIVYFLASTGFKEFPYAINLLWYLGITFFASSVISVVISIFAISSFSIRASLLSPVESLRRE
ncbi:ABC transporter permease [Rhodohalobacter sp. SW132]|uniref:ABC transporter permease n=1 Tax=Rhodohalobacter sp. SW132 TaxID=2293433 RepID=UPI000E221673|nr:ABC transporter permease [Rhodohalobacter sp. SW132]REL38920.1 ABC transporter permease [Rhodohalobacter sp. SW132]